MHLDHYEHGTKQDLPWVLVGVVGVPGPFKHSETIFATDTSLIIQAAFGTSCIALACYSFQVPSVFLTSNLNDITIQWCKPIVSRKARVLASEPSKYCIVMHSCDSTMHSVHSINHVGTVTLFKPSACAWSCHPWPWPQQLPQPCHPCPQPVPGPEPWPHPCQSPGQRPGQWL
jgi:hypothetical protein